MLQSLNLKWIQIPPCLNPDPGSGGKYCILTPDAGKILDSNTTPPVWIQIYTDIHYGDCTKHASHWASSCCVLKKKERKKNPSSVQPNRLFFFWFVGEFFIFWLFWGFFFCFLFVNQNKLFFGEGQKSFHKESYVWEFFSEGLVQCCWRYNEKSNMSAGGCYLGLRPV